MGAFLSVAQGSTEVPWLLELRLNMSEGEPGEVAKGDGPITLVGKGMYVCECVDNCIANSDRLNLERWLRAIILSLWW